jgi:hypothetical protein
MWGRPSLEHAAKLSGSLAHGVQADTRSPCTIRVAIVEYFDIKGVAAAKSKHSSRRPRMTDDVRQCLRRDPVRGHLNGSR